MSEYHWSVLVSGLYLGYKSDLTTPEHTHSQAREQGRHEQEQTSAGICCQPSYQAIPAIPAIPPLVPAPQAVSSRSLGQLRWHQQEHEQYTQAGHQWPETQGNAKVNLAPAPYLACQPSARELGQCFWREQEHSEQEQIREQEQMEKKQMERWNKCKGNKQSKILNQWDISVTGSDVD